MAWIYRCQQSKGGEGLFSFPSHSESVQQFFCENFGAIGTLQLEKSRKNFKFRVRLMKNWNEVLEIHLLILWNEPSLFLEGD